MKKLYTTLSIIIVLMCFNQKSLGQSVTFQFYHDLNNNCSLDAGEPLLYNLPGYVQLKYVNLSSNTITANSFSLNCFTAPISVSNPSVPATNTFSFIPYSSNPTFSINMGCASYTNLAYSGTNYLPVKNINSVGPVTYYTNTTGVYTSSATSVVQICNNMPNDSLNLYFGIDNIYSCGSAGDLTSSRTYSLYLDNILIDQAVMTGTMGSTYSVTAKMIVSENYYMTNSSVSFQVKLTSGPLSSGNHVFEVKSTPIYTTAAAAINHSMTLNAVPCTNITGSIYADCDNNCMKTSGDGKIFYGAAAILYNATNTYSVYPDINGNLNGVVPTSASQYSITSVPVLSSFTPCPAATATTAVVSSSGYDFGYKSGVALVDPSIYGPSSPGTTNPGSIKNINIYYFNYASSYSLACPSTLGTNPGKIKVLLDKNFTYLNVVGTTPIPNSVVSGPNGDTLIWNVANLNVGSFLTYIVSAQMASTVTIGTGFANYAWVYPTTDFNLTNNFSVFSWTVGLPCDPNNKMSWASGIQPNGDIPLSTTDLFYTINFQNVGTAPAINVKCADTLDANLDWNTLQVISSSFPVQVQIDNATGSTFFNFKNINLPDSTSNEPASHGYVHYRIKLKPGVPANTVIKNRAHNYFDFQPAVATNQTKNKLVNLTGITEIEKINSVFVAPNPVSDKVNVYSKEMIHTVSVFNNLGQVVSQQRVNSVQSQIDLSSMTDGVYFISIQFKDGSKAVRKVVKN
jgi:hypothetical protein